MEQLQNCPLCGKEMNINQIHLCGGTSTLIHTCINCIEIKIAASNKYDVIRKWNTFVTVANK